MIHGFPALNVVFPLLSEMRIWRRGDFRHEGFERESVHIILWGRFGSREGYACFNRKIRIIHRSYKLLYNCHSILKRVL